MSARLHTLGLRATRSGFQQTQRRYASGLRSTSKEAYQRFQSSYKSPYGPAYKIAPNVEGWTVRDAIKIGTIASGFGVAAGTFALFFFGEIPRVRKDILSKVPIFGDYWVREIAPEDNPF